MRELWKRGKTATVCDLTGVPLSPHDVSGGPAAGVHVCATVPDLLSLERHATDVPQCSEPVDGPDALVTEDEYLD